ADLRRRADVRAAAGAAVEGVDRDDAKCSVTVRGFAKTDGRAGILERDEHGTRLAHHGIRALLDGDELGARYRLGLEVERGVIGAEVNARRPVTVEILEY